MSREHLYKAKRVNWRGLPKEEWWAEGDLIHEPYGMVIQYYEGEIKDKGNCAKTRKKKRVKVAVDPETVCQYTGLTDKNGRKIFENDIFHIGDKNIPYFVEWHDTGFMGKAVRAGDKVGLSYWRGCIEIMENLHDNPKLLKGDGAE